ncbi:MAG: DUF86 domain-containing protein [Oscillospiraceae bacterium]|nr:DUF86 domain-containing protein [Oscillospiraceae bacterium]
MTNKDKNTLEHISMRCDRVSEDIARFGNSYEVFANDPAFCDSVSMNILQIGELTQSLSNEFKESTNQTIPWKQIYDMRCRFAHGYGVMAKSEIWDTALNDVPVLKAFCEQKLGEYTREQT